MSLPTVRASDISSRAQRKERERILCLSTPSQGGEAEPGLQGRGLVTPGTPGGMCYLPHANCQQKIKLIIANLPKWETGNTANCTLNKMFCCLVKLTPHTDTRAHTHTHTHTHTHREFSSFSRFRSLGVGVVFFFNNVLLCKNREKDQKLSLQRWKRRGRRVEKFQRKFSSTIIHLNFCFHCSWLIYRYLVKQRF